MDSSNAPETAAPKPRAENPLNEDFGKFAKEQLEAWKMPGVSVGVVDGDDIFAEGYGFASLPNKPATGDTLWNAGSTTKSFLAAAIAYLIDSKEYPQLADGWSTTLSSVMRDDFVVQDEWATAHLTLEDAVCHRTGFGDYDYVSQREVDGRQGTVRDVVRSFRKFPLWYEPRTTFFYCNHIYVALSHAVETITGKPLEETLRKIIWDPLEMKSTYFKIEDAQKTGNYADGYYFDDKDSKFEYLAPLPLVEVSGAGAIISNARDFAKWAKCLINQDETFSAKVHTDIRKPRIVAKGPSATADTTLYGLGWARTMYKGHALYHHNGGVHSGGSMIMWLPEDKFGVVAFGNTAVSSFAATTALCYRLIDDKLAVPAAERTDYIKELGGVIESMLKQDEDPVKSVYKDLAETPLPPNFTMEELVGTYSDPAWGDLTFCKEPDPRKPGRNILVATRPETTWKWEMSISHVSGDYWMARQTTLLNPTLHKSFLPARFIRGPNGKVSELVVEWLEQQTGKLQNRAAFKRVE